MHDEHKAHSPGHQVTLVCGLLFWLPWLCRRVAEHQGCNLHCLAQTHLLTWKRSVLGSETSKVDMPQNII